MYAQTLVSAVVSSAVISVIISQLFNMWKENREHKREAYVMALDAAETLERYSRACAQMIEDGRGARSEAGHRMEYGPLRGIDVPQPLYPGTIVWKGLDRSLVAELRELPNAYDAARRRIYVDAEHSDPIDVMWDKELEAARLGQRAWALAVKVRDRYELRDAESHELDWDVHKVLASKIEDDDKRRVRIDSHNLKMQSEISALFAGRADNPPDQNPSKRAGT